jgi:hypothetical protein
VTKKPAETRMGKGKGAPEYWVAVVKPGRIMFSGGTGIWLPSRLSGWRLTSCRSRQRSASARISRARKIARNG